MDFKTKSLYHHVISVIRVVECKCVRFNKPVLSVMPAVKSSAVADGVTASVTCYLSKLLDGLCPFLPAPCCGSPVLVLPSVYFLLEVSRQHTDVPAPLSRPQLPFISELERIVYSLSPCPLLPISLEPASVKLPVPLLWNVSSWGFTCPQPWTGRPLAPLKHCLLVALRHHFVGSPFSLGVPSLSPRNVVMAVGDMPPSPECTSWLDLHV